jgi:hypothetical protein
MDSSNNENYINCLSLSLIHPDNTIEQEKSITPISNMSSDCLFEFRNSDYISSISHEDESDIFTDLEEEKMHDLLKVINHDLNSKIGDGKMEYIKDKLDKEMFTNAWKAITLTNNWDFIKQRTDGFSLSRDIRINEITTKMEELGYNLHSGLSFGLTMRSMQYLLQYGEEEFKKMF